jgi:GNAT superfamily N-acetyltransferase
LKIHFHPATADRWPDVAKLFGPRGACGGCWCMHARLPSAEYRRNLGDANKRAFQRLVKKGAEPGILAYDGDEPVAWCALAPRSDYVRLESSRVLAPVDDQPVWSIVCFFVTRAYRGRGLSAKLLRAAAAHAASHGARIVEGYPVDPKSGRQADAFVWTGLESSFRRAGFREVARRSATRPIMRKAVRPAVSGRSRG